MSELLNENGSWNYGLLQEYFLLADVSEIMKIHASPRLEDDTLSWGHHKYGIFTIKSAYQFAFDDASRGAATGSSTMSDGRWSCWHLIWSCDIPPSVWNFAWKVATNSLSTRRKKHDRGLEVHDLCPAYAVEAEDNFHPLCRCTFAHEMWATMSKVWTLPDLASIHTGREWLLHVLEPLAEIERCMVLMTLWRVWHIRNEVVHHRPTPPMEASRRFFVSYLESFVGLKIDLTSDPSKGKSIFTYDKSMTNPHVITVEVNPNKWWIQISLNTTRLVNSNYSYLLISELFCSVVLWFSSKVLTYKYSWPGSYGLTIFSRSPIVIVVLEGPYLRAKKRNRC